MATLITSVRSHEDIVFKMSIIEVQSAKQWNLLARHKFQNIIGHAYYKRYLLIFRRTTFLKSNLLF